ncbi:MoaD/ThiS family protein [Salmonella enterica]|nr:MoaD/ThiS family protein [Salmonella enterica]
MDNNIIVNITIPKVIGESGILYLKKGTTIFDAIQGLEQHILLDKIMKSKTEFNQFVLVYLNEQRVKNPLLPIESNCCIDIIIPMAGG